jgi:NTP pyrophosphatase (non-canonical NTP hydrolase)
MGLSAQSVAKLEAGQTAATLAQFVALCAALDEDASLVLRQAAGRISPATAGTQGEPEMSELTFAALRDANTRRLPQFKNRRGEPAHRAADGSDWALSAWCNAMTGEVGEAANLIKKIERGDITLDEARADLGKELADVQTYLDILAFRAGVDLGLATVEKFNEVSERVGSDVRLGD